MRFVAIALIIASLPVFISLLSAHPARRNWALFALGVMLFMIGTLQIDVALVSWRLWQGTARGVFLSPIDTLSIALIATRSSRRNPVHFTWLLLLYTLPSILSLISSQMPMASLFIPAQILRIAVMFYALAGEFHRPSAMRAFFQGISVGLIIQCGFVVEQKLSGIVQAKGTTDHQNILGMMVEMSVIPLMALVLEGERRKLAYVGVVAALVVVAGGGSRASMAFTAAGLAAVMVLSLARRVTSRKAKFLGLAMLTSILVVPISVETLAERFQDRPMLAEDNQRPAFERAAKAMAADYPLGVGANNYVMVANGQGYSQRAGVSWGGGNLAAPVHNAFLLMRAETGWFGEVVMIFVMLMPLVIGLRVGFSNRRLPMLGMALATTIVAVVAALHSNFEYAWHLEPVQRLFFMNLSILSGCVAFARRKRVESALARAVRQSTRNRPPSSPFQPRRADHARPDKIGG